MVIQTVNKTTLVFTDRLKPAYILNLLETSSPALTRNLPMWGHKPHNNITAASTQINIGRINGARDVISSCINTNSVHCYSGKNELSHSYLLFCDEYQENYRPSQNQPFLWNFTELSNYHLNTIGITSIK